MVSRFEDLPNEVQEIVFRHFRYEGSYLIQCMLVCKSWKILFQNILYKDISFGKISKIKKFIATIEENEHLSSLVKTLNFCVSKKHPRNVIENTLVNLFYLLPGVERTDFFFQTYYRFLLNAVRLNHLPNLKYIYPPSYEPPVYRSEIEGYFNSAFILKHRLENLAIVDWNGRARSADMWSNGDSSDESGNDFDYEEITSVRGDFLLENLRQFKNIQELQVKKNCINKFEIIEKVTRDCMLFENYVWNSTRVIFLVTLTPHL